MHYLRQFEHTPSSSLKRWTGLGFGLSLGMGLGRELLTIVFFVVFLGFLTHPVRTGALLFAGVLLCFIPTLKKLLRATAAERSEEHTSELQSLAYLVCRLLLEKKNKITYKRTTYR